MQGPASYTDCVCNVPSKKGLRSPVQKVEGLQPHHRRAGCAARDTQKEQRFIVAGRDGQDGDDGDHDGTRGQGVVEEQSGSGIVVAIVKLQSGNGSGQHTYRLAICISYVKVSIPLNVRHIIGTANWKKNDDL
jgi:hypothetical protein